MINNTEKEIMKNWEGDITTPTVSICCTTYNHEPYIAEAIDGFLMQETDFPFEILIRDDCSTDKTASIVKEYADKYPNLIKPVFEKENTFSKGVKPMPQLYKIAKGKYIALCEGDDYWTDPLKLMMQVNFLENNLDYMMCFTSSENYDQSKKTVIRQFPNYLEDKDYTLIEIFKSNITNTCTVMYRNINMEFPSIFQTFALGDWPTHILYAQQGKIRYIAKNTAIYRVHIGGIWTSSQDITKIENSINMLLGMNTYFERKYEKEIHESIARLVLLEAFKYFQMKEVKKGLYFYQKSKSFTIVPIREKIIMFMDCCFKNLLKKIVTIKKKFIG